MRLCPCGIATATVVDHSPWPPDPNFQNPDLEFPACNERRVRTANQPKSTWFRAGVISRGVTTPVPCVYLPISLTTPGSSGSTEPTRLCRGCSHHHRRSPGPAASSYTPPLRRQSDGRILTSMWTISASWRTGRNHRPTARWPGLAEISSRTYPHRAVHVSGLPAARQASRPSNCPGCVIGDHARQAARTA
jgi:hypothetical protein